MIGLELFPDFGSGFNSRVSGRVGYSIFGFQLSVSTEIGFRPSVFEFRDRDSAGLGSGLGFRVWGSDFSIVKISWSSRIFGYPIHHYYALAFLQWSIKHHYRLLEDMRAGAGNQTFLSIICSIFRQTQTE